MDVLKSFHESLLAAKASGDTGYRTDKFAQYPSIPASKEFLKDSEVCRFEAISEYVVDLSILLFVTALPHCQGKLHGGNMQPTQADVSSQEPTKRAFCSG